MFKKENGFTLVELLGVILLLGLIMLVVTPPILEQFRTSTKDISKATEKLIYSSTDNYISKNRNKYQMINGNVFCIELQLLINEGELDDNLSDVKSGKPLDFTKVVKIEVENTANKDYSIVNKEDCEVVQKLPLYADKSGASRPVLDEGMIPITWDGSKWIKADLHQKWYDYSTKEWANIVLVTEGTRQTYQGAIAGTEVKETDILAYLVWIPRYKYKLFNVEAIVSSPQEIEIVFEPKTTSKSNGSTNGTYLTHPAFTFGNDELDGFWVGKFELTGDEVTPTVKPNVESLRNQNVSTQFATHKKFNNATTYGLTNTYDAHMLKNMEWGAITYLSHSKYGKNEEIWINPSSTFITGCAGTGVSVSSSSGCAHPYETTNGVQASTTGNVTGVYDMSGGAYEYVMGGMYNSGNSTIMLSGSGFVQATIDNSDMNKYIDKYEYDDYNHRKLGDAIGEVQVWYGDYAVFIGSIYPWLARGGLYSYDVGAGAFNFGRGYGNAEGNIGSRLAVSGLVR